MFVAGLFPGFCGYWLITPLYGIKVQLQVSTAQVAEQGAKPLYRGTWDGLSTTFKSSGLKGLWRGASAIMVRGGLLSAGQTTGYDWCKTLCKRNKWLDDGFFLHTIASVTAGVGATLGAGPADVVFTRYTTAKQIGKPYKSVLDCLTTAIKEEGPTVLYRGAPVFFVRATSIFIVYFPAYEQIRKLMGIGYLD